MQNKRKTAFDSVYLAKLNLSFTCLILISLLFLFLFPQAKIQTWRNLFFYFISPAPSVAVNLLTQAENIGRNITRLIKAQEENRILHRKLAFYLIKENEWQEIRRENERLLHLINLPIQHLSPTPIYARVITRDPQTWYHSLIIDRGSKFGIKVDAPVVAINNQQLGLVGRIVETTPSASKVLLISDTLSALVGNVIETGDDGVIEGKNEHELVFTHLRPEANIQKGQLISTAGIGGIFPPGIPVGIVSGTDTTVQETFRTVKLRPCLNLSQLREVIVLTPLP